MLIGKRSGRVQRIKGSGICACCNCDGHDRQKAMAWAKLEFSETPFYIVGVAHYD